MSTLPPQQVAGLLDALVDDAAVFPPGDASVPEAVQAHRRHRASWYADTVGPLLVRASQVPALLAATRAGEDLAVALVADTGLAGLVEGVGGLAAAGDRARLVQVEIALPPGHDPGPAATALVAQLALSVVTYVEVPGSGYEPALDVLAADGAERAKYRTGATAASAAPKAADLAGFVRAALDRRLPFKLTAGLHRAQADNEQHGFLNVLAAVAAGTDGASTRELAGVLAETALAPLLDVLAGASIAAVRGAFVSFGCCGVTDPVGDLVALGLLDPAHDGGSARWP